MGRHRHRPRPRAGGPVLRRQRQYGEARSGVCRRDQSVWAAIGQQRLSSTSHQVHEKPRWSRAFPKSGRRDLNSGPLVPQTVRAVGRGVLPRGAKWPLCSEFVPAPWQFAAFLDAPFFGRLCPQRARSRPSTFGRERRGRAYLVGRANCVAGVPPPLPGALLKVDV
jgi:hypothetical protein